MRHRLPRPSASTKVRGAFARLSARLSHRAGPMLALTAVTALTAGAALVVPARPVVTADAAMPSLSVARATSAIPGGHAASGGATRATSAIQGRHAASGGATRTPAAIRGGHATSGAATGTMQAEVSRPDRDTTSAPVARAADVKGAHRRQEPAVAAVPNGFCTLVVPAAPTSARGLTTPFELTATAPGAGACHEADPDQSAFVEAAVLDSDTGALSIYHPLVIDAGSTPAIPPAPVQLPAHAVVGLWFGFNGDTLTLAGAGAGACVNGLGRSLFGQFAYCDAPAFFAQANSAISAGKLVVPALGTGTDGLPCPTTRDFRVVDQDQSDNLATSYRVVGGRMAQDISAASGGTKLSNGSDEGLLAKAIDPALGCTPWTAPDLTTGSATMSPALALNELSAAAHQAAPVALVPTSDPMVLVGGATSAAKTNLYRAGVDMAPLAAGQTPEAYCTSLEQTAPQRLAGERAQLKGAPAPAGNPGSLYAFLLARYQGTLQILGCPTAR
jgi:hypothetical protein